MANTLSKCIKCITDVKGNILDNSIVRMPATLGVSPHYCTAKAGPKDEVNNTQYRTVPSSSQQ